jgi:hypothetical protein
VGKDAKLIAPHVSDECLNDALRLELNYLKDDLTSNAGDRSDKAFIHNAYAVLTRPITGDWLPKTKPTAGRWKQSRRRGGRSFMPLKIIG